MITKEQQQNCAEMLHKVSDEELLQMVEEYELSALADDSLLRLKLYEGFMIDPSDSNLGAYFFLNLNAFAVNIMKELAARFKLTVQNDY